MSYLMNHQRGCLPPLPGFAGGVEDKAKAVDAGLVPNWLEDNFFTNDDAGDAASGSSYWPVVAAVSVLALGGAWVMRKGSR